ncbi:MAG: chemotaxis protein CheX [Polyangiaceae bacterium]
MEPSKDDLSTLVTTIWSTLLGVTVKPPRSPSSKGERIQGRVAIAGAWTGAVTVEGPVVLARIVAGMMMGKPPEDASHDDLRDAWAELTNVTGGNVKATLPSGCSLGLPSVRFLVEGGAEPASGEVVIEAFFDCDAKIFRVRLETATATRES